MLNTTNDENGLSSWSNRGGGADGALLPACTGGPATLTPQPVSLSVFDGLAGWEVGYSPAGCAVSFFPPGATKVM